MILGITGRRGRPYHMVSGWPVRRQWKRIGRKSLFDERIKGDRGTIPARGPGFASMRRAAALGRLIRRGGPAVRSYDLPGLAALPAGGFARAWRHFDGRLTSRPRECGRAG
jgi:hypothetical protein